MGTLEGYSIPDGQVQTRPAVGMSRHVWSDSHNGGTLRGLVPLGVGSATVRRAGPGAATVTRPMTSPRPYTRRHRAKKSRLKIQTFRGVVMPGCQAILLFSQDQLEADVQDHFIDGLKPNLKRFVLSLGLPDDLCDCLKRAKNVERAHSDDDSSTQNFTPMQPALTYLPPATSIANQRTAVVNQHLNQVSNVPNSTAATSTGAFPTSFPNPQQLGDFYVISDMVSPNQQH